MRWEELKGAVEATAKELFPNSTLSVDVSENKLMIKGEGNGGIEQVLGKLAELAAKAAKLSGNTRVDLIVSVQEPFYMFELEVY